MRRPGFPSGRPRVLALLPQFLFAAGASPFHYIIKAWLLALIPSLVVGGLIASATAGRAGPEFSLPAPLFVFLVVVAAPLLETLLMVPPLLVLARFAGPAAAVIANALLWAVLHSLAEPLWGLVVWWPFLILSAALLTWRERGLGSAILVVSAIHAMQNVVAAALPFVLTALA